MNGNVQPKQLQNGIYSTVLYSEYPQGSTETYPVQFRERQMCFMLHTNHTRTGTTTRQRFGAYVAHRFCAKYTWIGGGTG